MTPPVSAEPTPIAARLRPSGKFLAAGSERARIAGVAYGPFGVGPDGVPFPSRETVRRDLTLMARNHINTVRTFAAPPRWLLDEAASAGLRVMVGLPWGQDVALLADREAADAAVRRVRAAAHNLAGHPAVLCYLVGSDIPSATVRWHGPARVERFLRRLADAVREEDPGALVTYVHHAESPALSLPFLDLLALNPGPLRGVTLDDQLRRLHTDAGTRPVLLVDLGLDSVLAGEPLAVADSVAGAVAAGCAGTAVFGWVDEWEREAGDDDAGLGLVTPGRRPGPGLEALRTAYGDPLGPRAALPRASVVVCARDAAGPLSQTLEAVARLDYPGAEVIVIDDGSTDATAAVAREFGARTVTTERRGTSSARNLGAVLATGEIVAYLDPGARPDPDWLRFLAAGFAAGDHVYVVGPAADAAKPDPANVAFRRDELVDAGGFDPRFRRGGELTDLRWRLEAAGRVGARHPGALIELPHRGQARTAWAEERGRASARAALRMRWPGRLNRPVDLVERQGAGLAALVAALALVGTTWSPLLLATTVLLCLAIMGLLAGALAAAARAQPGRRAGAALRVVLRPAAVAAAGLDVRERPGRRRPLGSPWPREYGWRSDSPTPDHGYPAVLDRWARCHGAAAIFPDAGPAGWDIEVRTGDLAGARVRLVIEESPGANGHTAHARVYPFATAAVAGAALPATLSVLAVLDGAAIAAAALGALTAILAGAALLQASRAAALAAGALAAAAQPAERGEGSGPGPTHGSTGG